MDPRDPVCRQHDRRANRGRNQHHPRDRAGAEYRKINHAPQRLRNRTQYEQRNRRAARKSMHQADAEGFERGARCRRKNAVAVEQMAVMGGVAVRMMRMDVPVACGAVLVHMRMDARRCGRRAGQSEPPAQERKGGRGGGQPQRNKRQPNPEFHRQTQPYRHAQLKHHDRQSDNKYSQGMAQTPQQPGTGRGGKPALAGQDCGNRDHMVGVGGMAHPKHESERGKAGRRQTIERGSEIIHSYHYLPRTNAPQGRGYRPRFMTPPLASACSVIAQPATVITAEEIIGSHLTTRPPCGSMRSISRRRAYTTANPKPISTAARPALNATIRNSPNAARLNDNALSSTTKAAGHGTIPPLIPSASSPRVEMERAPPLAASASWMWRPKMSCRCESKCR